MRNVLRQSYPVGSELSKGGFTLIEILVTVALFSLGALGLAAMQVLSIKGTGFNKEATVALGLAQRTIEDFKNVTFGNNSGYCGTTQQGMTIACTPTTSGTAPCRYEEITVTVTWGTPTKQIRLYTIVAEK